MKSLEEASEVLMDNLIFVLNHSMDLKKDGVDPMIPFAIVVKGTEKILKAFAGDTADYGDQMFERTIREEKPDIVVYASDSYITSEGVKYDAVLFKAYDKNDSEVYLAAQKFKPQTDTEDFELIGNPKFMGTIENPHFTITSSPDTNKKSRWKFW